MKKENLYTYTIYSEVDKHRENIKKIKLIATVLIILVTIVLIIITRNIQVNIQTSEESASIAIMQTQVEEKNLKKEEEKQKILAEEIAKTIKKEQEEAERKSKTPQLTEVGKEKLENIYHSDTKVAYLTFDDGPSNVTHQILDTLKNENVKATFFMLGSNVETFPETTKRVYDEGHYIANHGYTHMYSSIYSSPQAVLDEYNRCNTAVQNAIGNPEYNSHLFRFPGGLPGGKYEDIKQEAKQLLNENGILNIDWNALTGDAETQHPEEEKLMEELQQTIEDKNSVVILMHDTDAKKVTADMLPRVIAYLKEQGYEFKTFYDIIM